MQIRFNLTRRDVSNLIPLSMVEDSVDDMYFGCSDKMMKTVTQKYRKELVKGLYADALKNVDVEKCVEKNLKEKEDKALTKNHMEAICAYTSDDVYQEFNPAVRTNRSVYTSSFQFHILHFFLTSAIQILNNKYNCSTTYRRTNVMFTGNVNQRIRFGSFSSTSFRKDLLPFGNKSCFKITTCTGANLKNYSVYGDEEEVLIPPYEVFRITKKYEGNSKLPELKDCDVVFVLKSEGVHSRLNCKIAHI
ncbi:ecto-ADP-ribosyltransferase 5-like [Acanthochromis polyacanthus]|uniref:ecto-ADP-ribosyltransferase 5-like n=1 Tax=Acanthochromis polyacanthus TaxID=80966 RepID=UPI002234A4F7|nr:ecto-ADP-ribosyltransferase 5-like [Acanthochromis polyacanthus]